MGIGRITSERLAEFPVNSPFPSVEIEPDLMRGSEASVGLRFANAVDGPPQHVFRKFRKFGRPEKPYEMGIRRATYERPAEFPVNSPFVPVELGRDLGARLHFGKKRYRKFREFASMTA
jgi:hypothetical protein